jgi:hypothetical protein
MGKLQRRAGKGNWETEGDGERQIERRNPYMLF